tara:strand:+ start:283 stop:519 length:237 start_codon:yes stop_codon:yes gene_type:complete
MLVNRLTPITESLLIISDTYTQNPEPWVVWYVMMKRTMLASTMSAYFTFMKYPAMKYSIAIVKCPPTNRALREKIIIE